MSQHRRRSRIANFSQPFIVGALGSLALATACATEPDTDSCDVVSCNPPSASTDCPVDAPEVGSDCSEVGQDLSCSYFDGCETVLRCNPQDVWVDESPSCNPPPQTEDCPVELPEVGSDCSDVVPELTCSYGEGECVPELSCHDGSWFITLQDCREPIDQCPAAAPEVGDDCVGFAAELSCSYFDGCETALRCNPQGVWADESPTCNPPPPMLQCPEEMPADGDSCADVQPLLSCSYGAECPLDFSCQEDGIWRQFIVSCNPPPPLHTCPEVDVSAGDSCAEYEVDLRCMELDACGGSPITCSSEGVWVAVDASSCNPPYIEDAGTTDAGADASAPDAGEEPDADAGRAQDAGQAQDAGTKVDGG